MVPAAGREIFFAEEAEGPVVVPTRSFICLAMVTNDCSTFVASNAEVSRNGIPISSASSYLKPINLNFTFPAEYSTALLALKSLLFPTNNFETPSDP